MRCRLAGLPQVVHQLPEMFEFVKCPPDSHQLTRRLTPCAMCRQALPARQTAILDADGHSGWELARALLRPRRIVAERDGRVAFKSGGAQRIAATAALRHTFIRNGVRS